MESFIQSLKSVLSSNGQVDSSENYSPFERSVLEGLKKFDNEKIVGVAVSNSMLCAAPKQVKYRE